MDKESAQAESPPDIDYTGEFNKWLVESLLSKYECNLTYLSKLSNILVLKSFSL